MVCLAGKLAGLEDEIDASSAIHSEAEEVKGQLKEHKVGGVVYYTRKRCQVITILGIAKTIGAV